MRARTAALALAVGAQTVLASQRPPDLGEAWDDEARRFQDVELAAVILHQALDDDCDGRVALDELARTFGVRRGEERAEQRLAAYDEDGNGEVTPVELASGIRSGIEEQVDISFLVDANDDGALTLKEHALGFPDVDGTKNDDGFTTRQLESFRFLDEDGDGRLSREEVEARHRTTFIVIAWAQTISRQMERIDTDGNGIVDREELARGLGHSGSTELTADETAWYDIVAPEGRPGIVLDVFRVQLLQNRPVRSRLAMERPIRPLLVPTCVSRPPAPD